ELMKKCFDILNLGGVWVSYCAKGSVRRGLKTAGFDIQRLPGPPGKREMLRAIKT
ncbi:methyltransferase, partial [Bacteroidetes bacterium SCGC AAA795-G10]